MHVLMFNLLAYTKNLICVSALHLQLWMKTGCIYPQYPRVQLTLDLNIPLEELPENLWAESGQRIYVLREQA